MRSLLIKKEPEKFRIPPHLTNYELQRKQFTWEGIRNEFSGLPGGGFNIAFEAVDRRALSQNRDHVAIRWLGKSGNRQDFTYADLSKLSNRFANALKNLEVNSGDRVFLLSERIPALYIAAIGALKRSCVFCPLFSAFGPEPIQTRLQRGGAKVLVTTENLYRKKVAGIRASLPDFTHVIVVRESNTLIENTHSFDTLIEQSSETFEIAPTKPDDLAILHFTSGTTGTPKGAMHVHEAALMHYMTGKYALDLHEDDIFWCTADPGWVTGTSYGILSPLLHGVTSIIDQSDFNAERWYRILQDERVTVWYTAPTALRMLMKAGDDLPRGFRFENLRLIASVGEPLNPEVVWWGEEVLGRPIHDNWWQTETGGIMISNTLAMDIKPGSMGKPLPGVEAAIVRKRTDGSIEWIQEPNVQGELALKKGWPSMFRGYLNDEERYRRCFSGDWYLTGDLAKRDEEGYFWFVGRADDVIKSAGHLIGPFEVESALLEHPAVAEAGVIGLPDPVVGETVKAFISLKAGHEGTEALRKEIQGFARTRLGAAVAPKEIEFLKSLPKTRSGKIMRRLLKARALGLPEGDTSTLEEPA